MDEDRELEHAEELEMHVRAGNYFTREALARCVEVARDLTQEDLDLAQRIRADGSFDIAVVGSEEHPEVRFLKFEGITKIRPRYSAEAVVVVLERLEYMSEYMAAFPGVQAHDWWIKRFPSTVQPREPHQER